MKEELRAKMLGEIEKRIVEFKKVLGDVIRIPTDNPPGDTSKCADFSPSYLHVPAIALAQARRARPTIIFMWMSTIQKSPVANLLKWKLG